MQCYSCRYGALWRAQHQHNRVDSTWKQRTWSDRLAAILEPFRAHRWDGFSRCWLGTSQMAGSQTWRSAALKGPASGGRARQTALQLKHVHSLALRMPTGWVRSQWLSLQLLPCSACHSACLAPRTRCPVDYSHGNTAAGSELHPSVPAAFARISTGGSTEHVSAPCSCLHCFRSPSERLCGATTSKAAALNQAANRRCNHGPCHPARSPQSPMCLHRRAVSKHTGLADSNASRQPDAVCWRSCDQGSV